MWAVATRGEPSESIDIVREAWSSALDPRIPPEAKERGATYHFQGDHRCVPSLRVAGQVSAHLGAVAGGGARHRGEVRQCAEAARVAFRQDWARSTVTGH